MRILAISDIYGNEYIIEELCRKFSNYKMDIIIVAGGISYIEENNAQKILELLLNIGNKVLFVPGGTDNKDIKIEKDSIINLDNNYFLLEDDAIKVGFFGLGGVPNRSLKRIIEYPYRWIEIINKEDLRNKLEINYQKLKLENPDFIILVSHTPPYHIADYSKKIVLSNFEISNEEDIESKNLKKKSNNPVFLGSHILKEFVKNNKIDLHIFGHVHKQGGKKIIKNKTIFINISHLSPMPYKLTGRKACIIEISNNINIKFKNIVNKNLDFDLFLQTYL